MLSPQVASVIGNQFNFSLDEISSAVGESLNRGDSTGRSLAFSSDGQYVIIATDEGAVPPLYWKIEELDELLERGCKWLNNHLNDPKSNITEEQRSLCDEFSNKLVAN